jgi:hypothetical protein
LRQQRNAYRDRAELVGVGPVSGRHEDGTMNVKALALHACWILAATLATASEARADGVLAGPGQVAAPHRAALSARIHTARQQHPDWFARVGALRDRAASLDAHKRGRLAPISPLLRAQGANALLPMLEMIAFDAKPRAGLNDTAWRALRAGLLEAVGELRDPDARPVLEAVLDGPEADPMVVRAAAEALAKLGGDQQAAKLTSLARIAGPRQPALIEGLGQCRRLACVTALSEVLAAHPSAPIALAAVRALGTAGAAWAWKTPSVAVHASDESAVRETAARALVDAFSIPELRAAASNALMMVDAPSTPTLIADKRQSAPASLAAELDRLAERFARNPTR